MTTRSGKERREVVRAVAEKPAFQGRVKQWQHVRPLLDVLAKCS